MMNENFFGKYSVFCVFGSVVGCVVVPLIAQVLQQQSMECMILSAIVLTLTAAHLKKGGSDGHHAKLLTREEKKKYSSQASNTTKKQKANNANNNNGYNHKHHHHQQQQHEQEYLQQFEHLKILEMEKRNEEKRLKKQKKREERLKRKEEENKKIKEHEEKRAAKEKRKKKVESNENVCRNASNPHHINIAKTYEKYCCGDTTRFSSQQNRKPRSYSQDENQTYNKHYVTRRQNIPRFNNQRRFNSTQPNSYENSNYARSNTDTLSINCSSLSTSCSSLSSIGSSGSCSPPPPPTPPKCVNIGSAWKTPCHTSDSESTKSLSPHKYDSNGSALRQEMRKTWTYNEKITEEPIHHRVLKSYTNVRPVRNKVPTYNLNSSSLFCSSQDEGSGKQLDSGDVTSAGEYSLFGSHQFGNSFMKSPII